MVAGGVAGVALSAVSAVRAEEPCARVVAAAGLPARWAGPVEELRRQIALLPASECRPMTLSVQPAAGAVRVDVLAADGRHAARDVSAPDGLVATALGLLLTIPAEAPAASAPALPATPPPAVATSSAGPLRLEGPSGVAPLAASAPAGAARMVWAGVGAGVRLTAPTGVTVLDAEARADVFFDRWLLLSTVRSALVSCLGGQGVDCDVYNDVSFGVGAGGRVRAGTAAVDLALEPSVVWMHMEYDADAGSEEHSVSGSEVTLRLDASARMAVPLSERWALTVTIDAGLAPVMLRTTRVEVPPAFSGAAAPPPFPAWTGGVRVGASGAIL
jgi:hypothetical protein